MKPVICIAGPTASGKSRFALQLAQAVDGEIINADALQVYEDICILSARPNIADLETVPHHLYGYVSGSTHYSGGEWVRSVMPIVLDTLSRGKTPILVGGTGLYFKSLIEGLAFVPDIETELVKNIETQIEKEGIQVVVEEARRLDPIGVSRLLGKDPQRLVRLLSVVKQTGQPLHEWQTATRPEVPKAATLRYILMPARERLYEKINNRFEVMVDQGGLDEAKHVFDLYGQELKYPMLKAIGLSHLLRHLKGEWSLEDAVELAKRDTRRFAKRQMTWFRNQCSDWQNAETLNVEYITEQIKTWSFV